MSTAAQRTAAPARILGAARAVFAERGYESATTRAISERAGVAKGLVYHHFGSKEEILFRVCLQVAEDLLQAMEGAIGREADGSAPFKERLRGILLGYSGGYPDTATLHRILLDGKEHLSFGKKAAVVEAENAIRRALEQYLRASVERGQLRRLEPAVMAFTLLGSLDRLHCCRGLPLSFEAVVDQIVEIFVSGASSSTGVAAEG